MPQHVNPQTKILKPFLLFLIIKEVHFKFSWELWAYAWGEKTDKKIQISLRQEAVILQENAHLQKPKRAAKKVQYKKRLTDRAGK